MRIVVYSLHVRCLENAGMCVLGQAPCVSDRRKSLKKILCLYIFAAALLCAACNKRNERIFYDLDLEDTSLAEVLVRSKLIVGVDTDFAPLSSFSPKGDIIGYDVDVLTAVADYLDIDVEFVDIDWDDRFEILNSGRVDCLASGLLFDEASEKMCEVTGPYIRNALVAVVLKIKQYRVFNDLKGKILGVRTGSKAMEFVNKTPSFQRLFGSIKMCRTRYDGIRDLKIGAVDAFITDLLIVPQLIKGEAGIYTILREGLSSDICVFGFKKGRLSLKNAVNAALAELEENGTIGKISKKWFNTNVSIIGSDL